MAERYRYSTDEVVSIICGDKEVNIEESDCSSEDLACGIEFPVALDSETEAVEESYGCFTDSNHESDDEMVVSSQESSPSMKDSSCLSSEDSSVLTEISSESSEESSDSSRDQKTSIKILFRLKERLVIMLDDLALQGVAVVVVVEEGVEAHFLLGVPAHLTHNRSTKQSCKYNSKRCVI